MIYLAVEIACQSCSFRIPDFQNYQKTYELPPPTTIFGMAGAALGFSPKSTQEFFDEGFEFGVCGSSMGKTNDLWKFRNRVIPQKKNNYQHFQASILRRELLFNSRFIIVFGHADRTKITYLYEAFNNPEYALSLGKSDELAKIVDLDIVNETINCDYLKDCIVDGDLLQESLENPDEADFSLKAGDNPIQYEVPVAFKYDADYGVRRVAKRKQLSFLGAATYIKGIKRKGILFKGHQIPTFTI